MAITTFWGRPTRKDGREEEGYVLSISFRVAAIKKLGTVSMLLGFRVLKGDKIHGHDDVSQGWV